MILSFLTILASLILPSFPLGLFYPFLCIAFTFTFTLLLKLTLITTFFLFFFLFAFSGGTFVAGTLVSTGSQYLG